MADEQKTMPLTDGQPVPEAWEQTEPVVAQEGLVLEAAPVEAAAPTEVIPEADPVTFEEGVSAGTTAVIDDVAPTAPAQPTAPMPEPMAVAQPTTPIPAPPAPVAAAYEAGASSAKDPFAPATASVTPPAPPSPEYTAAPQARYTPAAGTATPQAQYAAPAAPQNYGSYASAMQHNPYAPDSTGYRTDPYQQLSGGMKFGWLLIGMFMGIPGMLLAWLTNEGNAQQVKKDAILWSVIGFAINVVFVIVTTIIVVGILAAAASSAGSYSGYYF